MARNLLTRLYSYRPREGYSSRENFLTEAFAETLAADDSVLRALVAQVIPPDRQSGSNLQKAPIVQTQVYLGESEEGRMIADLVIDGWSSDGRSWRLVFEHKWDSPVSVEQLTKYRASLSPVSTQHLVCICPDVTQRAEAKRYCTSALIWEEVGQLVDAHGTTEIARMFGQFLGEVGLGPQEPLSAGLMAAYCRGSVAPRACERILQHLLDQPRYTWEFVPERYRLDRWLQPLRYDRVVIAFNRPMTPGVCAGFIVAPNDLGIPLADPQTGFDLGIMLWGTKRGDPIRGEAVARVTSAFRLKFGDADVFSPPEIPNKWFSIVVRQSAADVLAGATSLEGQASAVYQRLRDWGEVLFADGQLERDCLQTWPAPPSMSSQTGE